VKLSDLLEKVDPNEILIQQDPENIKNIPNPSLKLQLLAVKQDGLAIKYILCPKPTAQAAAVKQNIHAILNIDYRFINPALLKEVLNTNILDEFKLQIIKAHPQSINYIKNPSDEMKLLAVQNNGYTIMCIKKPSIELQLAAVQQNGGAITVIKKPSKSVVNAALTDENFIKNNSTAYDEYIRNYFKNNGILANKWLRYADNVREM
jgi:hypothetical protein